MLSMFSYHLSVCPTLQSAKSYCVSLKKYDGPSKKRKFIERRKYVPALVAVLLCIATQVNVSAQTTNVGRISGTVIDSSKAVIPGASITVIEEATGASRRVTTDSNGAYVVTNLPVGTYRVSVEQSGFGKEVKTGFRLDADGRITADFVLQPGTLTGTVEISTSAGETVNTVSGEISRVVDGQQVQDLALNGRNFIQLASLIPGVALIDEDQMAVTTGLGAANQSVNGVRPDQNLLTVDGGFDLDSGSNGSQINNVGVDFIQEVSIKTSNFSAEYGRNSGGATNAVTRRGGNSLHGGGLEFIRNDALDARNSFSPQKQKLRFNDFGWNLGGPIKKDKFFFFAGEEWKKISQDAAPTSRTLPTTAMLQGDFRALTGITLTKPANAPVGCIITNNVLSPQCISADGKAIASLYSAMQKVATSFTNTFTGNNTIYQVSTPFDWREDFLRLDYRFSEKHSIFFRYLHDSYSIELPFGFSCAGAGDVPSCPENRRRPGTSYQLSHTWLMSPTLVNEAYVNASWNGQRIPPTGDLWKRDTYGFTFPQVFAATGGGRFRNSIPDITFSGTGTNPSTVAGQSHSLLSPTTDIAVNETLTWTHGSHTLKTGAVIIRNRKDQNARSLYAGQVSFQGSGTNANSTRYSFADALMGNFQDYQEASDDPVGFFRFTQFHAFLTDSWKVRRNLSLEIGMRYQYVIPTYTQANQISNFDPALYVPTKAVTVLLNGTIDASKGGNPLNGLIRAGSGVPSEELGRVPNGASPAVLAVPAGAPRGLYHSKSVWAPRFGFAWQPFNGDKTSVRGGFGIFYDTPEGNMIFDELTNPPFIQTVDFQNGNLSNPTGGKAVAAAPLTLNAIDPNLKLAYTTSYSLSIQRQLPHGFFLEVAYVGNRTKHLLRKPDINMPSLAALLANAALPTAQRATSINALRPFKGYAGINMFVSDASSNYNGMQAYITKRKGDLRVTGSYTWSHVLTDSGGGNNDVRNSGTNDNIQDATMRFLNYGPAPFDRRHIFVATYSYDLPFWRNAHTLAARLLGGWEVSGITRAETGEPYTVTANSNFGGFSFRRRADYIGGDISLSNPAPCASTDTPPCLLWFNRSAFAAAAADTLGTSAPGMVRGPGRYLWDISLRKEFPLPREGWRLRFQTDFFNAFNHVNYRFSTLTALIANNTNINNGSYGKVSPPGPPRQIQFALKLTF